MSDETMSLPADLAAAQEAPTPEEDENPKVEPTKAAAERLRARGFKGALRIATIAGAKYLYRAVSREEYRTLLNRLGQDPEATQADLDDQLLALATVEPKLMPEQLDQLGYGVPGNLLSRVQLLSGFTHDALAAYTTDEKVSDLEPWAKPTDEEVEEAAAPFAEHPHIRVRTCNIIGYTFVYRTLSGDEYRPLASLRVTDQQAYLDMLVQAAVVWPRVVPWGELPYAVAEHLAIHVDRNAGMPTRLEVEGDEVV